MRELRQGRTTGARACAGGERERYVTLHYVLVCMFAVCRVCFVAVVHYVRYLHCAVISTLSHSPLSEEPIFLYKVLLLLLTLSYLD